MWSPSPPSTPFPSRQLTSHLEGPDNIRALCVQEERPQPSKTKCRFPEIRGPFCAARARAEALGKALEEGNGDFLQRVNHRNGYREPDFETHLGTLDLAIPKLRKGSDFPCFLEPRPRWVIPAKTRASKIFNTF